MLPFKTQIAAILVSIITITGLFNPRLMEISVRIFPADQQSLSSTVPDVPVYTSYTHKHAPGSGFDRYAVGSVYTPYAPGHARDTSLKDRETITQWLIEGSEKYADGASVEELISFYAQKQLGIPYVGGLLEVPPLETLVVTLEGSDCVLFVEFSLAFTVTILQGSTGYEDFTRNVALFRYQQGTVDGYASRLHYFSDWLKTNEDKGLLQILHQNDPDLPQLDNVTFMSANRTAYRQLAGSDSLYYLISARERHVNSKPVYFIPQDKIRDYESTFQTGDILAFVSTIDGLDIAHTALVNRNNNTIGFFHASTTGQVIKDPKSIYEYTRDRRNVNGIIVARLIPIK